MSDVLIDLWHTCISFFLNSKWCEDVCWRKCKPAKHGMYISVDCCFYWIFGSCVCHMILFSTNLGTEGKNKEATPGTQIVAILVRHRMGGYGALTGLVSGGSMLPTVYWMDTTKPTDQWILGSCSHGLLSQQGHPLIHIGLCART